MLPKGLASLGNLGGLMKNIMEMKSRIEAMKDELGSETIEGAAGGGLVSLTMNGKFEVLSVKIDPEVIDKDDPEMLATLVQAAMNNGVHKVQEMMKERMSQITGGLDLPGLSM